MESPIVAEKRRREMKSIFFCIASHNFVFIVHGNCISEFVLEAKEQRDTEKLFGQKKDGALVESMRSCFYKYLTNYMFLIIHELMFRYCVLFWVTIL